MALPRLAVPEEKAMMISTLIDGLLTYKASKGGARNTDATYRQSFKQFLGFLQSRQIPDDLRNFNEENVEAFAAYLIQNGRKATSVGTKLAALSSLGVYGMRVKKLQYNPADKRVERPKVQRPPAKYLYRDELKAMLSAPCHAHEMLMLSMLVDTQLRATELAEAKVRDLSLDGETVVLNVIVKGGRPETVELKPALGEKLLESLRLREAPQDAPLLVNSNGDAWTRKSLSSCILRIARRAGITRIPVRAHVFARHSIASILGQEGATVFEIAALLRHKDISTAQRYVHGVSAKGARERAREIVHA